MNLTGAPSEAAIFLDEVRVGTVNASGTFSKDVSPGVHVLELRKSGFEDFKQSHDFKVSETLAIQMRPAASGVVLHVAPANAKITLRRDTEIYTPPNEQTAQLPPGSYLVTATAENFKTRSETVQVEAGKPLTIDWALQPVPHQTDTAGGPPFTNGGSWIKENGWMVHAGTGISIYTGSSGTHVIDILKHKNRLGFGTKRTVFLADYHDKGNFTQYGLDGHNLFKIILTDGKASNESKLSFGQDNGDVMRIIVELSPDEFIVKNRIGKVIDSIKKPGIGHFAFSDDVTLNMN
jgi:hypothetical protein